MGRRRKIDGEEGHLWIYGTLDDSDTIILPIALADGKYHINTALDVNVPENLSMKLDFFSIWRTGIVHKRQTKPHKREPATYQTWKQPLRQTRPYRSSPTSNLFMAD